MQGIKTRILKVLYDLNDIGYTTIYFPEYEMYILHQASKFYNPGNHIYDITVTGKDITNMIDNFAANFQDKHNVETTISNLPVYTFVFDYQTRFTWVKK